MNKQMIEALNYLDEQFDGMKKSDIKGCLNEYGERVESLMLVSLPMIRLAAKGLDTPITEDFIKERKILLNPENTSSYVKNIIETIKLAKKLDQKYGIKDFSKMTRRLFKISIKLVKQDKESFKKMKEIWKRVGRIK